jgi:hypothetical protein
LKRIIYKFISLVQELILRTSYFLCKLVSTKRNKNISWVIGVSEISSTLYFLGNVLKPSTTVCLDKNPFYKLKYSFSINISNRYFKFIYNIFYAPTLLGYLMNKNTHFLYIWHTGFLLNRDNEFKFLKSKDKKIVCIFLGSDIRSPKLSLEYTQDKKIDNFISYTKNSKQILKEDKKSKVISESADKYSDLIFSFKLDQISYIENKQIPWTYMYPKNRFYKNEFKFHNMEKIKILHAPSNPLVKGTPLIRAAIKKLELEGYYFEYVELQGLSNEIVLENLKTSHIVLNQFYGYDISLGLFAIETMASNAALMMSYDPKALKLYDIKLDGFENCCFNTKYWEVYDNLKYLLDNPEKIKYYADNGYDFAYKHYTYEAASEYINNVLKENGVID